MSQNCTNNKHCTCANEKLCKQVCLRASDVCPLMECSASQGCEQTTKSDRFRVPRQKVKWMESSSRTTKQVNIIYFHHSNFRT